MYDAIVVGGRCAGASVALLLARQGLNVLIIDHDKLPNDKKMSTHLIWHAGIACLKRWGLLGKLEATNCPPQNTFLLDFGPMQLRGNAGGPNRTVESGYAPRRIVLDTLLLNEARSAGVEFREGCSLKELIRENERICGVRFKTGSGELVEARARIVIGADGINSTVAKLVDAGEYNTRPKAQQTYFSYFSGVELTDVEFHARPGRMGFAWSTNDDQIIAGFCCRLEDSAKLSAGPDVDFWNEMDACAPDLSALLKAGKQEVPIRVGGTRSFLRQAGGPGWALIGDAGINMDPISAAGISNAFIQAEMLAELIETGIATDTLDASIEAFTSKRDERLGPLYEFTSEMAQLNPETPDEVMQLFVSLQGNQPDIDAYFGVFAQTMPVTEFFDPANVQRIIEQYQASATASS